MAAVLDDVALLHDQNEVGVADGGQTVGDDEAGAVFRQPVHGPLGDEFCPGVHGGGGLVQNEHGTVLDHGPGNGEQLLLSGGNGHVFAQHGVEAVGQRLDEVVDAAGPAGGLKLRVGDAGLVIDQILPDGALEQPRVLQNHAEQAVDALPLHLRGGDAVDADLAGGQVVESHEQVDHGGLARAGGADDGHLLAGLYMGGEVLDDDLVRVVGIGEAHVVELHLAPDVVGGGLFAGFVGHLRLLQKVEDPVPGGGRGLHLGEALSQRAQRGGEQPDVHDEGDDDAELDLPADHEGGAQHAHRHVAQVAHDVHQRLHDTGQELTAPVGIVHGGVHAGEGLFDLAVGKGDAHHVVAGVHFLHVAVEGAEAALPGGEVLLGAEHDQAHGGEAQHGDGHGGQRHAPLGDEHHDQAADELRPGADHGGQGVGQGLLEGAHVVGNPAEQVAVGHGVEVAHRHPVDLSGQVVPHGLGQVQRDGGHDEVHDIGAQAADAVDDEQPHADLPDGGKVDACHQSVGDEVGDVGQLVGADDGEDRPHRRQQQGDGHGDLQLAGIGEQLPENAADAALALLNGPHAAGAVHTSLLTHFRHIPFRPALRGRAGTWRSPGIPGSFSSARRGCRCPQPGPRPAPRSYPRGGWCRCAGPR